MNYIRIVFAALLGLLSSSIFAFAEKSQDHTADTTVSTESTLKQYVVSFHDNVSAEVFDEVSTWITNNKGEIIESINENFAKLIIAKSDESIRNFHILILEQCFYHF